MTEQPRHERLSDALCEAVELGHPTRIRIGRTAWLELLASLNTISGYKLELDVESLKFEGVPINREQELTGCVVEHDNRYMAPPYGAPLRGQEPIPDSVVMMNDTRKPAIKAW